MSSPSPRAAMRLRGATRKSLPVLEAVRAQRAKILRQLRGRTVLTDTGCLEWRGVHDADRQARISIRVAGRRTSLVASRVLWALHHDEDPGDVAIVRTVCKDHACVNVMEHCELATMDVEPLLRTVPAWGRDDVR